MHHEPQLLKLHLQKATVMGLTRKKTVLFNRYWMSANRKRQIYALLVKLYLKYIYNIDAEYWDFVMFPFALLFALIVSIRNCF